MPAPRLGKAYLPRPALRHTHAVVFYLNYHLGALDAAAQGDGSSLQAGLQAMLDAVFDQRLQQHARHQQLQGCGIDLLDHAQLLRPETHHFDAQVVVGKAKLLAEGHIGIVILEQRAQDIA